MYGSMMRSETWRNNNVICTSVLDKFRDTITGRKLAKSITIKCSPLEAKNAEALPIRCLAGRFIWITMVGFHFYIRVLHPTRLTTTTLTNSYQASLFQYSHNGHFHGIFWWAHISSLIRLSEESFEPNGDSLQLFFHGMYQDTDGLRGV